VTPARVDAGPVVAITVVERAMVDRPAVSTVAQARVLDEVLAWGVPRPRVTDGLSERLLARLGSAVGAWIALRDRRSERGARPLLITKTRLSRLVCDGLQREPAPYVHAWANVRGTLVHAAIESDVDGARDRPVEEVVEQAWVRLAADRPGDPSSISHWLNVRDAQERSTLLDESATLLAGFREVWPDLSGAPLRLRTEQRLATHLGGRSIRLQGVPDLIIDSPVDDGHARALLIDLKTGMPRGQRDRDELRFYALLATLARPNPPFRWATLYVTEGRIEHEDLSEALLTTAADRVADAILQAVRLAEVGPGGPEERLTGGGWCAGCRRQPVCPVALAG
jgi:hypothetical protein